jgi:hypothetical protein
VHTIPFLADFISTLLP